MTPGGNAILPAWLAEQGSTTEALFAPFGFLSNFSSKGKKKKKDKPLYEFKSTGFLLKN